MKSPLLRTTVFSLIFVLSSLSLHSQWVSIPDTNFGTWLNTHGNSACMQGNNGVGWQMDTTCSTVINTVNVYCINASIRDLSGIQYFDRLKGLYCWYNSLSFLPQLPRGLTTLHCNRNQLTLLQNLPDSLSTLDCSYNLLTSLPSLPGSLIQNLSCGYNQLTLLPSLPTGLISLYCYNNQITSLPALPSGLTYLGCQDNQLTSLPILPDSLSSLNCSDNHISSLSLPASLKSLICFSNPLNSLPPLPSGLTYLYCGFNGLDTLPALPDSLITLNCSNTQIRNLPALPVGLNELACGNSQISTLPILPAGLTALGCSNNNLEDIPELPDSLSYLIISGNPVNCLPRLKRVVQFDFTNTNITCLPNYGNITNSSPPLNSVPLCDEFNSNGCEVLGSIRGNVFLDVDSNCAADSSETRLKNIPVRLWKNGKLVQQMLTETFGSYFFDTDSFSTYIITVDTTNLPFRAICPANGEYSVVSNSDSIHSGKDFAVKVDNDAGFDLVAQSISGKCGRHIWLMHLIAGDLFNFYDAHHTAGVGGTVQLQLSNPISSVTPFLGTRSPDSIGVNTITWNISDFDSLNYFYAFSFSVELLNYADLGSQVCVNLTITPTAGDNNPANNALTQCFTVVGSFDPNDKQVYPEGNIDTTQEWLTYTIRFQNTGTDTAFDVYITDTLDNDLDYSTFQLLAYSHQPMVQIKENAVRFNFPNIYLPDSNVNEPLSHGYVQYKIKIKDGSTIGTQINNTAFIYFDFNEPVVTNTTTNTIALISGIPSVSVQQYKIQVYPNPATNELYISGGQADEIKIYNTTGSVLLDIAKPQNNRLDISTLPKGVYIAEVKAKGEIQRLRWVKM